MSEFGVIPCFEDRARRNAANVRIQKILRLRRLQRLRKALAARTKAKP